LPFLRSLNEMETSLCHFTIDDHLKRYSMALAHLSQCASSKTFDDVLVYVTKHDLYQDAMRIYKDDRDKYDVRIVVSALIADHPPCFRRPPL
jgi:elongator complex protein 1